MSLRINLNDAGLMAHRRLTQTDAAVTKAIERLSSGFRVNTAADDPAGLAISENLRAQLGGISTAIKNSQDAINMVKTAEGALTEVHTLLRSMRDLAVHASNAGVNNPTTLAADQAQIQSALESINRIASTTAFGTKKLLDGSSGVTGTSTNSEVTVVSGSVATKAGTYAVRLDTAASQAYAVSTSRQVQQATAGAATGANNISGTDYGILRFGGALVNGGNAVDIRVYSNDTIQDVINRINSDAVLSRYVKAGLNAAGDTLVFTSKYLGATAGSLTVQAMDGAGTTGTAANVKTFTGVSNATADASVAANADGNALLTTAETLTLTDTINGKSTTVALVAGDSLSSVVAKINTAAQSAGVRVMVELQDAGKLKWTNTAYGSSSYAAVTVTSSITVAASPANLGIGNGQTLTISASGAIGSTNYTGTAGQNVSGTINGESATGQGQYLIGNTGNANTDGLKLKITTPTASGQIVAQVTIVQGSTKFQIGANAAETASVAIDSVSSDKLGETATGLVTGASSIADIDVTTFDGAQDAIKLIDAAIEEVSRMRANLGAFQKNVLQSNINSLGVAYENLAASQSSIRDADMAQEMVEFTRNQILLQAGTAMLTQANQVPQALLQMLR
ncbi:MAG: flagellin N-terminal helical domain-containing protein [Armatimonadota bacterium]